MDIKYIRCFASHDWRRFPTDLFETLLASFVILIYQKDNNYFCESRVTIADTVTRTKTTEQNKNLFKDLPRCIGLLQKFNELMPSENNSIDIFNFNSNDDFPFFIKWLEKRNDFLNLELEKNC